MGKTGFCAVFCLLLIVADVSNASSIWKLRKLIGVTPNDNSTAPQITPSRPSPSPGSEIGKLDPKHKDGDESKKNSKDHPQAPNNSTGVDPKGSNNTVSVDPATANQTGDPASHKGKKNDTRTDSEKGKKDDTKTNTKTDSEKEKNDNTKTNSQAGNIVSCDGILNNCTVPKTLIACIPNSESGSKELIVVVQNKGESNLKVNLIVPSSEENAFSNKPIEIPKHQTKTVNISLPLGKSTELKVNAGNGECMLNTGPQSPLVVPEGNYILRLPSYEKLVTPVNGAYFLLLTVLMFGGTWGCCKLWKRRRQGGVPYQELEMGLPESASATNIETTEGWDNGWDDDWDEDNAVKSPGGRYVGSISANGLTARSANKDGWENDWDD